MLRLEETRITQLLKETIRVICRSADSCSEIAVQGLLGITLDRKEIFLVQINDVIDMALERAGTAFHASASNIPSTPQSSHGLINQAAAQLQPRLDLNLSAASADGRTSNNSATPEIRLTRQSWRNSSVGDSTNNSLLQTKRRKGEKVETNDKSSLSRLSDVQGPQDCNTTTALVPCITVPQTMSTSTAVACISNRGRGAGIRLLGRRRGHGGKGRVLLGRDIGQGGKGRGLLGSPKGQCGMVGGLLGRGRGLLERGRGLLGRGRGLLGSGRGQRGMGRGLLGRGRGQLQRGKEQLGSGRRQCGRGRGYHGRGGYQNKDMSPSGSRLGVVALADDVRIKTRGNFITEQHSTFISTVNNYSQCLENLSDGNESQTVGTTVQRSEHKTLKTLKQPAFKRKLKPFGVITSKKSKHANCFTDSGFVIGKPLASSCEKPPHRCFVCKRAFTMLTELADHYTKEHNSIDLSPSPVLKTDQNKTAESVRCSSPLCGRSFTTLRGMLQHCGRIHSRGRPWGRPIGEVRCGTRFGMYGNFDEKPVVENVVGQIIPSLPFESGVYANVLAHSLPHTITSEEFNNAEGDSHAENDSVATVKEEIETTEYTDNME